VSLKTATLCLVLAGMGLFGVARSPGWVARSYARAFDDEVVSSRPALWPVLAADPALHALLVRETQPAYEDGGWAAAARRLDQLIFQQIIVHAGDSEIAACNKAWVGVKASLLARPAECRLFLDGGSDGFVAARVAQANEACLPALRDGARRRQEAPRRMMSAADYAAATALSLAQPDPLSASQRAALAGRFDDDRLSCAASLQRDRNLASLPDGVVAAYRRRDYALGSVAGAAGASAPVDGGPPADLVCPRAGTVLVLRVAGARSGKPAGIVCCSAPGAASFYCGAARISAIRCACCGRWSRANRQVLLVAAASLPIACACSPPTGCRWAGCAPMRSMKRCARRG
jgi:hypothetical protein